MNSKKHILVKGDVSGIQDFIFNVNSKGAAQSLKGRSFFIKILLQVVMQKVFYDFNITDETEIHEAKISVSGGNFFLKLNVINPDIIDDIQLEITKALRYTGLNMMLTYVDCKGEYKETLQLLNQKTRERKYSILVKYEDFFETFDKNNIIDVLGQTNNKGENKKWHGITRQLKKRNNTLIIEKKPNASQIFKIFNDKIEILGYEAGFGTGGISLDNYLESVFPLKKDGTYKNNDDVIKFEELAMGKYSFYKNNKRRSFFLGDKGLNKLGVLAMDVDNLGIALEEVDSSEKHTDFDNDLYTFFNKTIKSILDNHFKTRNDGIYNVYTVNAGGDDSLFVGKWNTMIDLAIQIKNSFDNELTKKYPKLSISAAIVIIHPNFPVVRFAQLVNEALKEAKYRYDKKGNISIFGEIFDWNIFKKELQEMRKDFIFLLNKNIISAGLLAKARQRANSVMNRSGIRLSDYWEINYYMRPPKSTKLKPWQKDKRNNLLKKYNKLLTKADKEKNPLFKRNYKLVFPFAARLAELDKR